MLVQIRPEFARLEEGRPRLLTVLVELHAPEPPADRLRPPLNISLVVDRSGSMSGGKLAAARDCASWLAERLGQQDRLALVSFDDKVRTLSPLVSAGSEQLRQAIAGLRSGGSTNLSGGWLAGVEALVGAGARGRVLLLSDGMANVGIREPGRLAAMAADARRRGAVTTTIGFGRGFDEELMTGIADAGGGSCHYAAGPEDAPAVFAAEIGDLARLVAQNVGVEIVPEGGVRVAEVLGDHPSEAGASGPRLVLGDAYAGQRRRLVFTLELPAFSGPGMRRLARVAVVHAPVGSPLEFRWTEVAVEVALVDSAAAAQEPADLDVSAEAALVGSGRIEREAAEAAERGRFAEAQRMLGAAADALRELAVGSPRSSELLARADQLEAGLAYLDQGMWTSVSKKAMHYRSHSSWSGKYDDPGRPW